jgi:hypothetical protein
MDVTWNIISVVDCGRIGTMELVGKTAEGEPINIRVAYLTTLAEAQERISGISRNAQSDDFVHISFDQ